MSIHTGKFGWFPTLMLVVISNALTYWVTVRANVDSYNQTIGQENSYTDEQLSFQITQDDPSPTETNSLVGKTVKALGSGPCVELPTRATLFAERNINVDCTETDHPRVESGNDLLVIWSHPANNGLHAVFYRPSETIGWISESNISIKE